MAADSGLFVVRPAVNSQDFFSAEAQLPVQKAVETPAGEIQDPADARKINVRVEPDLVGFHQAFKCGISVKQSVHIVKSLISQM